MIRSTSPTVTGPPIFQNPSYAGATLADALTSPTMLFERFGTAGVPSDQTRKMLDRATRLAAALNRSPAERATVIRDLIENVIVEQQAVTIRIRRSSLSGGAVLAPSSENPATAQSSLQRLWPSGAAVSK